MIQINNSSFGGLNYFQSFFLSSLHIPLKDISLCQLDKIDVDLLQKLPLNMR